ncbi:monooxygenase family protein [Runella sp.]|uniref:monooxygenase family protein n=1 Tax=Runella sp. TaxID=1960881 RepID=UPI003D13F8B6
MKPTQLAPDLSEYPNLVVIYLGMTHNSFKGLRTIMKLGPQIDKAVSAKPEGLLHHENLYFGFMPLHVAMRQYWKDFESMERWTRALPHQQWWKDFLKDPQGTRFWHEAYCMKGGMEGVYLDIDNVGFLQFAPKVEKKGRMFSSRDRLDLKTNTPMPAPIYTEKDLENM